MLNVSCSDTTRVLLGHHAGFTIVRDAVRHSAGAPLRL